MNTPDRPATLDVSGMTCQGCERNVADALARAGAVDVSADHRRGVARFRWPAGASEQDLREAVAESGYTPGELRLVEPAPPVVSGGNVDYDLAVIGSGGAAFAAAIRATNLGARVAIVERGEVGGTCVNVGCVPSKTLLAAADAYHTAGHHPFAGVPTGPGRVDLAALVGQKDELVAGLIAVAAAVIVCCGLPVLVGAGIVIGAAGIAIGSGLVVAGGVGVALAILVWRRRQARACDSPPDHSAGVQPRR